jgi:cell division septation protein DedD
MGKLVYFLFILLTTIINSFAQKQIGDYDFVVTVLDNFKKPIKNLEVRLKNEDEDLISKTLTLIDGTIEFRGLLKNKSYHLEFEKSHEKLKNSDKIYIKDIVKTEEIAKAETGFDYFVFVGENVSFSEIGIRDPRPDNPEEVVQNTKSTVDANETKIAENTNSASVVTNNGSVNEAIADTKKQDVTTNTVVSNSSESTNKNSSDVKSEISKVTSTEVVNEAGAETKKQDFTTNTVASNSSESTNKITTDAKSETSKVTSTEAINEAVAETKKQDVTTNTVASNSSDDISKNQKSSVANDGINFSIEKKTEETTVIASENKSTKNEITTTNELVDFSILKDKDFNNLETHELLIKEEEKIKNKKINYKVQIGAYTHQEIADKIRVNGFKVEAQTYPDGFTRVTVGNCNSIKEAEQLRKKLIAKGMKDSWILGFYETKRFTMKELVSNNFFQ